VKVSGQRGGCSYGEGGSAGISVGQIPSSFNSTVFQSHCSPKCFKPTGNAMRCLGFPLSVHTSVAQRVSFGRQGR